MKYKVVDTDLLPGRAAFNETYDCSVKAVAAATGFPYQSIHETARLLGRVPRRGFHTRLILQQLEREAALYYTLTDMWRADEEKQYGPMRPWRVYGEYPTLAQSMDRMQQGRYVVLVRRHALAVVDGVIYDNRTYNNRPRVRCRVHKIYQLGMYPWTYPFCVRGCQ